MVTGLSVWAAPGPAVCAPLRSCLCCTQLRSSRCAVVHNLSAGQHFFRAAFWSSRPWWVYWFALPVGRRWCSP